MTNLEQFLQTLAPLFEDMPLSQAELEVQLRRRKDSKAFSKNRDAVTYVSASHKFFVKVEEATRPDFAAWIDRYLKKYKLPEAHRSLWQNLDFETVAYLIKQNPELIKNMKGRTVPHKTVVSVYGFFLSINWIKKTENEWKQWIDRFVRTLPSGKDFDLKALTASGKAYLLCKKNHTKYINEYTSINRKAIDQQLAKAKASVEKGLDEYTLKDKRANIVVKGMWADGDTFFEVVSFATKSISIRVIDFQQEFVDWIKAGSKGDWEQYYYKTVVKPSFGNPLKNAFYRAVGEEAEPGRKKSLGAFMHEAAGRAE